MRRAEVIDRTLRAVELAEPHLPAGVGFSAGWRTNGRAGFNPRGAVNHTTEDAGPIGWSTLYRILRDGHGAIAGNALCNEAIRHDTGRVVIMASGTAWHAGAGGWRGLSGNASVWGREMQRGQGQTLTADQLHAARVMDWALSVAFGWPVANICEHFEWAPGRKQDRRVRNGVRIDAAAWRASVRPPAVSPSTRPPSTPAPVEDDDMAASMLTRISNSDAVYQISGRFLIPVTSPSQAAIIVQHAGLEAGTAAHIESNNRWQRHVGNLSKGEAAHFIILSSFDSGGGLTQGEADSRYARRGHSHSATVDLS